MRVRVSDGWTVYVEGQGQVPAGAVVDVHDVDEAAFWVAQGWAEPAPDATVKAVSKRPEEKAQATTKRPK